MKQTYKRNYRVGNVWQTVELSPQDEILLRAEFKAETENLYLTWVERMSKVLQGPEAIRSAAAVLTEATADKFDTWVQLALDNQVLEMREQTGITQRQETGMQEVAE